MKEELKLHLLRTMLLESDESSKVLASIRKFQKQPTKEQKNELILNLRQRITTHAKDLMTDEQIERFINDIPKIEEINE